MPELPDVECFARRMRAQGLGRRIESIDLRDPERLRGARPRALEQALRGQAFEAVRRHGKVLFAELGSGRQLVMHFGMTGFVAFYDDADDEPEHARLVLGFDDGGWFAWDNQRRFGWLELCDEVAAYVREQPLGPDALDFDRDALQDLLSRYRGMVKPALMDQEKIAGIGNIYSDEILFQAGIRPDRKADALSADEVAAIHERLHAVLTRAADRDADPARMPRTWLIPHRDTGDPCPRCGTALESRRISGRTGWYCPRCQS